jgi:hypothetical protein
LTKVGTPAKAPPAPVDLDRVEARLGLPHAPGRVPGDLGGGDLAPPEGLGQTDGVVLAQGVVPEDVHSGPFLESRHRYLSPGRVDGRSPSWRTDE